MHQLPLFEKFAETLQCEKFSEPLSARKIRGTPPTERIASKYPAVTSGSLLVTPTSNQIIRRLYPGVDTAVNAKHKRFQFIISVRMPYIVWPFATVLPSFETIYFERFSTQTGSTILSMLRTHSTGLMIDESLMHCAVTNDASAAFHFCFYSV